jgi:hypothetical protein
LFFFSRTNKPCGPVGLAAGPAPLASRSAQSSTGPPFPRRPNISFRPISPRVLAPTSLPLSSGHRQANPTSGFPPLLRTIARRRPLPRLSRAPSPSSRHQGCN